MLLLGLGFTRGFVAMAGFCKHFGVTICFLEANRFHNWLLDAFCYYPSLSQEARTWVWTGFACTAWFRKDFASQLGFGSILLGRLAFGSMWLWRHGFRHILLLGLGFGIVFPLRFGLDRIVHALGSVGLPVASSCGLVGSWVRQLFV